MVEFLTKLPHIARFRLRSRARLEAQTLVPRQHVIVLSRKSPPRVQLSLACVLAWLLPYTKAVFRL